MNEVVKNSEVGGAKMVTVTLPDESTREIARGTTVIEFAAAIGPGLAKVTVGARLNGEDEIVDLRSAIDSDCRLDIVKADSDDGLHVIRHSASHIMADAICRIWPDCKLAIGPSTDKGFYYDIDLEHRLTEDDLGRIEKVMAEIIAEDLPFERSPVDRQESLDRYAEEGEIYKVELIEGFDPEDEVSVYLHGSFEDLCRGPHVPSTGHVKAVKILKIAGAYWRGDEKRQMLQRIYGTAFHKKKDLSKHLHLLEEAKKRDHRRLGKDLDLFSFHPEAPASPFFHPKGTVIYNLLKAYARDKYLDYGYDEVITPQILDVDLWKRSGHWDKYKDNMYFTAVDKAECGVKPMNCPCHALIYGTKLHSYRDLPVRYADFGRLHRYERSGVTAGLTRVRTFAQDDAHIFCREDQIGEEISQVIKMLREIYDRFEFPELRVYLSTRPEVSVGSSEVWEKAEKGLEVALAANEIEYTVNPGDGAFYGPKIDFVVLDALEREWQIGTVQLDFIMPERFELEYVTAEGGTARPVMIHRAILGSLERFMGIVIEHYAGAFPLWLAPVQARVAIISDAHLAYGEQVVATLRDQGFRVDSDFSNGRIGGKIRNAQLQKIPFVAVVGDREVQDEVLAIRERGGKDHGSMSAVEFRDMMHARMQDGQQQSKRGDSMKLEIHP